MARSRWAFLLPAVPLYKLAMVFSVPLAHELQAISAAPANAAMSAVA
jgi:hypothetical protein